MTTVNQSREVFFDLTVKKGKITPFPAYCNLHFSQGYVHNHNLEFQRGQLSGETPKNNDSIKILYIQDYNRKKLIAEVHINGSLGTYTVVHHNWFKRPLALKVCAHYTVQLAEGICKIATSTYRINTPHAMQQLVYGLGHSRRIIAKTWTDYVHGGKRAKTTALEKVFPLLVVAITAGDEPYIITECNNVNIPGWENNSNYPDGPIQ